MSIAKIIAPLTGSKRDSVVLETAFAAARPFNAHVVALLVTPDPRLSIPTMGAPLSPQIVQNVIDAAEELNQAAAKTARATLDEEVTKARILLLDRPRKEAEVTCSFHETTGSFARIVARAARLSDLVVLGPITPADGPDANECFVEILTRTDRPLLLCANAPAKLAGKIAIAWDGSAAACHAVITALPYLARAEEIAILHIGEGRERAPFWTGLPELKEYLSLHGLKGCAQCFNRESVSTGEALLVAAHRCGADMLVMGGYGHGHLREAIFGGVTDHIRSHAELPVLLVH